MKINKIILVIFLLAGVSQAAIAFDARKDAEAKQRFEEACLAQNKELQAASEGLGKFAKKLSTQIHASSGSSLPVEPSLLVKTTTDKFVASKSRKPFASFNKEAFVGGVVTGVLFSAVFVTIINSSRK